MNHLIKQIVKLNQQLLESASHENWDQVVAQSKQRQHVIESFFESCPSTQLEKFVQVNKSIRTTDEKVKSLMQKHKKREIQGSLDLQKTQSALKAYQAHQS